MSSGPTSSLRATPSLTAFSAAFHPQYLFFILEGSRIDARACRGNNGASDRDSISLRSSLGSFGKEPSEAELARRHRLAGEDE